LATTNAITVAATLMDELRRRTGATHEISCRCGIWLIGYPARSLSM
jgi:hypothetical protein